MKLGTMLGDVVQSLFKRPFTENYPVERNPAPARLRGKLTWDPEKCVGCGLCTKDCPSQAIELIVLDKASKRFVLRYHVDRCVFCGQCVQNCRFSCIHLSNDQWELAALDKNSFTHHYGKDADIKAALARPVG